MSNPWEVKYITEPDHNTRSIIVRMCELNYSRQQVVDVFKNANMDTQEFIDMYFPADISMQIRSSVWKILNDSIKEETEKNIENWDLDYDLRIFFSENAIAVDLIKEELKRKGN